jgi:HTH-type transcriptional regulator/antitoxin HigA
VRLLKCLVYGVPKSGTARGDRLDTLATLIDAYEAEHYPMDTPDQIEAVKFRLEQLRLS